MEKVTLQGKNPSVTRFGAEIGIRYSAVESPPIEPEKRKTNRDIIRRPANLPPVEIYRCMRFGEWVKKRMNEDTRYSVEVNYRTKSLEVLKGFAKIALGYVSAAMKNRGFHVKRVFEEDPIRIVVSSRNWDDGEWVGMIHYRDSENCFVVSNGFYNKDRSTVTVQRSERCSSDTPSDMTKSLVNMMHYLKHKPDKHLEKLKPVKLKRGPKK